MPKQTIMETNVKSVLKALAVMEQYIDDNREKGIHELSAHTGIPVSSMQRLVNTLQSKGYLMQNPKTRKYRLGFTLYHLYKSFLQTFNWVDEARGYMETLVLKHEETINLAYLEGKSIVYLTKVDSPLVLRPNFDIGTKYPAHCSSLGKCLLAYLPHDSVKRIFSAGDLKQLTGKTKADLDLLVNELSNIRRQGYAIDDEEFQEGLRCLAVPIKNKEGVVVASMSVAAPINRMPIERLLAIKGDMFEIAKNISALID